MPGMTVLVPGDATECAAMVRWATAMRGPVYLRLGREGGPDLVPEGYAFVPGRVLRLREGGDVLLEALATALPREPRLRLTLAGPGELPPAGEEQAAASAAVEWAGWLGPAERDELLRSATVFVMPSRSEGLPMALLEAMAYGTAVVATEVGGIPEVVEDGVEGLLVAPEDPAALSGALRELAADPVLRERLGAAARVRAEALDAVEVAGRLSALYESLG